MRNICGMMCRTLYAAQSISHACELARVRTKLSSTHLLLYSRTSYVFRQNKIAKNCFTTTYLLKYKLRMNYASHSQKIAAYALINASISIRGGRCTVTSEFRKALRKKNGKIIKKNNAPTSM